jgi:hypothetical protein
VPLVFSDTIPAGLIYKSGSATHTFTSTDAIILYSTDSGATWSQTEPVVYTDVTNIQWWLTDTLKAGHSGSVSFEVTVPITFSDSYVENCVETGFGDGPAFTEACTITLIEGVNTIGDTVWQDDNGNGVEDGGESGLAGVSVSLYLDRNGDGALDGGDLLVITATTSITGHYTFNNLPNGDFLVQVDSTDPALPFGFSPTTEILQAVTGLGTSLSSPHLEADFGFGPSLAVSKTLLTSPASEGGEVQYTINLTNLRSGDGTGQPAACQYMVWATIDHPSTGIIPEGGGPTNAQWANTSQSLSLPDNLYASTNLGDTADKLGLSGFNTSSKSGNIVSVEAVLHLMEPVELKGTDSLDVRLFMTDTPRAEYTFTGSGYFTDTAGSLYTLSVDVTGDHPLGPTGWSWTDFENNITEMQLEADPGSGSGPSGDVAIDAAAYVITTDETCDSSSDTLNPVPLSDTYDASKLEFVSADPAATTVTTGGTSPYANTGTITKSSR